MKLTPAKIAPVRRVWCVKDRNGWWCATHDGREPPEGVSSVKTKCGDTVALPWGINKRVPTCQGCSK